ncbi:uncharacterized protein [Physcomitrium patens]|uniref:BRISC and BRCA1-A complex member 1 n=1 Tax=Physcomitrium patens TaxID=3218 RepID=A9S7C1_PHYPA|nr:BRISC and BRCA1-A complex member 1-like isoform X1 [Physcomitrium patens]PNR53055.1 hypothetical protein PHYPA_009430 [Physcomitrium patens]|eukprot:XP_024377419.1 BRISC and BRCA1-A complex member 1-like isoform X1 [Physcomitrella patens]
MQGEGEAYFSRYGLRGMGHMAEDILFCVDADAEMNVEMKLGTQGKGLCRLDAIKQAIILFVHSKLMVNSQHRFAFATLRNSASWLKRGFSSDIDVIGQVVRGLASSGTYPRCDLSELFRMAAAEAHQSIALNRRLRMVLIYCRSSVPIEVAMQWPDKQRLFTFDALYLHDKPTHENCPQDVYDSLVDALERVSEFESYIFESSSGSARLLFRSMCILLSHPQQRCPQDEFEAPKDISKMLAAAPHNSTSGNLPVPRRETEDNSGVPRPH